MFTPTSLAGEARLPLRCHGWRRFVAVSVVAVSCAVAVPVRADVVELQNGDRYNGRVLSFNTNSLVLQSEVLGTVSLPRAKVTFLMLGNGATNLARPLSPALGRAGFSASAGTNAALSSALRELGSQTNLIQQVRSQFLHDAGPAANDKFDQLLNGLISGKISLSDLRAEAQSAADQLRAAKKDLGPEAGDMLDGYLSILDRFLGETPPPGAAHAKSSAPPPSASDDD